MKFSKSTVKKLGHYVYALVDPRDGQIFYVGKASGNNRAFSHLDEQRKEPSKNKRINEIRESGREPSVQILRYGIDTEKACFDVEATVIDAIGIEKLTNVVRGHGTERGRQSSLDVERMLGSDPVDIESISENFMMFFIHKSYSPTMSEPEIYDCTRQFWYGISNYNRTVVREDGKLKYPVALGMVDSVVVRAYSIVAWFSAGCTLSSRASNSEGDRWEFVGQLIPDHHLLQKRLRKDGAELKAAQQGYAYINSSE